MIPGMRVAIVGATGLLGNALGAALLARGDAVTAVSRTGRSLEHATSVRWDGVGPVPEGAFDGCDAVVNLAGAPVSSRWSAAVKREIAESRVDVTERVVAAIGSDGPTTLVNASAVGYYGNRDDPVDESAAPGSGFLANVCRSWEAAALAAQDRGVRVVLLRSGIVLARDGGALPKMVTPTKLGLGGPIAGGKQWLPWVHIDDAVGLILLALDTPTLSGPVNVVAPGILRQGEFAKVLGDAVHRPAITPTPALAMKLMFGEGAAIVLEGQHVTPAVAHAAGYAFRYPTAAAALAALDL